MAITSVSLAHPMDGKMHKEWCEQNWEKCKVYMLEKIKLKEKYLPKERECVEKAKSYRDMKLCMMDVKEQKRREGLLFVIYHLFEAFPNGINTKRLRVRKAVYRICFDAFL